MTSTFATPGRSFFSFALCAALLMPVAGRTAQAQDEAVVTSATFLLKSSVTADRRGQFSLLLRSLRQLQDPALKPLYKELMLSENRTMRIHGILGLAECDPKHQVDLTLLAEVKDATMQSELVGAALDSELLDVAAAKQVMAWPALDMDAKVVIATHLLSKNEFKDANLLKQGVDAKNLTRQSMIGLLLTQLGDPAGPPLLDALDKSTSPGRDDVQVLVLQTAFRFKLDKVADWAAKLSTQPGVGEKLGLLALRTAMRFGHKPSMQVWSQQYNSSADVADKMRLALSLLNLAPYVDAAMFDPIIANEDPLMKQMGLCGKLAASQKPVGVEVGKLIAFHHGVSNAWALGYATFHATPDDARGIYSALIHAFKGNDRNKAQRLDEAMVASQALFEKDAKVAAEVLRPLLNNPDTEKELIQGILIGLIRVTKGEPQMVVDGLTRAYDEANSNGLKLLLQAKHGVPLGAAQLKDLGLLIRGGGSLPDALRLQAAWAYLKQTKQADAALATVLKQ